MPVFFLIVGVILCCMVGTGIGKLRYTIHKRLKNRKTHASTRSKIKFFNFMDK